MPPTATPSIRRRSLTRRWIRRGFLAWTMVSTIWLANSIRTQGVDPSLLRNSVAVSVADHSGVLEFHPTSNQSRPGLIFLCGSGIAAEAYAPLLRPVAEKGYFVCIVRLPLRFAPFDAQKEEAIDRAVRVMSDHPEVSRWVVSGHSLGAALACRLVDRQPSGLAGVVLLGTTHPRDKSLSWCKFPMTKVYASNDGIAPAAKVLGNKDLLPSSTAWVEIKGGNHSLFGHYGHQLFDGEATIGREEQQRISREAIQNVLERAEASVVDEGDSTVEEAPG